MIRRDDLVTRISACMTSNTGKLPTRRCLLNYLHILYRHDVVGSVLWIKNKNIIRMLIEFEKKWRRKRKNFSTFEWRLLPTSSSLLMHAPYATEIVILLHCLSAEFKCERHIACYVENCEGWCWALLTEQSIWWCYVWIVWSRSFFLFNKKKINNKFWRNLITRWVCAIRLIEMRERNRRIFFFKQPFRKTQKYFNFSTTVPVAWQMNGFWFTIL